MRSVLFLIAVSAFAQDIVVKNGSGLVTASIIKNQTAGAQGTCREYQTSDSAIITASGRICGKFQSGTNFDGASLLFQTTTAANVFATTMELRGDQTMRMHGQEIFDNAKLLEWLDTAGTGITLLDLDNANNVRIGAQLAPTTSGDMYLFVHGNNTAQFRFFAGVYDFSPTSSMGAQMGGLFKWASIRSNVVTLDGVNAELSIAARDNATATGIFGPTSGVNSVWNLPATLPSAGQVLTASTVVGSVVTTAWAAGLTACGTDTEVFYNAAGSCGADTRFKFDYTGGFLRLGVHQVFDNAKLLEWKDTAGTGITVLDLDSSNDLRIGTQLAPTSSGDMYLFVRGTNTAQFVDIAGTKDFSPFASLGAQMGGAHVWASLRVRNIEVGGVINGSLQIDALDNATATTITGPTTGTNVVWRLPNSVPTTGDTLVATTSGSTATLSWTAGVTCGGTCMTTNTAQSVTGTKTMSGANILTATDDTNTIGGTSTEFQQIFSSIFTTGRASTRNGQINIYNSGGATPDIFVGGSASGVGPDTLFGNIFGSGTFSPVSNNTQDLGYIGNQWRSLYVNTLNVSGSTGLTATKTVRDAAGTGTCTLSFVGGIFTASTC